MGSGSATARSRSNGELPEGMTTGTFRINGEDHPVVFATNHTLLEVVREECKLPGTKHGCELGECGACAVLVDGEPILSCLQLAADALGKDIETIEGLQNGNDLHPLQQAFADLGAAQCGYCTPGILMVARALIDNEPDPSEEQITEALSGNICRCTGYKRIVEGIKWGAAIQRGDDWRPDEEYFLGTDIPGTQDQA